MERSGSVRRVSSLAVALLALLVAGAAAAAAMLALLVASAGDATAARKAVLPFEKFAARASGVVGRGDVQTVIATCPAGSEVVGGGYAVITTREAIPIAAGVSKTNGYFVTVLAPVGALRSAPSAQIKVSALCLRPR